MFLSKGFQEENYCLSNLQVNTFASKAFWLLNKVVLKQLSDTLHCGLSVQGAHRSGVRCLHGCVCVCVCIGAYVRTTMKASWNRHLLHRHWKALMLLLEYLKRIRADCTCNLLLYVKCVHVVNNMRVSCCVPKTEDVLLCKWKVSNIWFCK